jgi:hypothetical protein
MFTVSVTVFLDQSAVVIGGDVLHPCGIHIWFIFVENSFHIGHGFVYTVATNVSVWLT